MLRADDSTDNVEAAKGKFEVRFQGTWFVLLVYANSCKVSFMKQSWTGYTVVVDSECADIMLATWVRLIVVLKELFSLCMGTGNEYWLLPVLFAVRHQIVRFEVYKLCVVHVLWICLQVTTMSTPSFCRCVIVSDKSGWDHLAGELVSLTFLLFHSSVKLKCIASCFIECDPPSITDIIFASKMCLYFDTIEHLCFLCFMMPSYIFIAAFVWVLSIKYTFYIKSIFQCLWLGPS
jgi:hypothetical protein